MSSARGVDVALKAPTTIATRAPVARATEYVVSALGLGVLTFTLVYWWWYRDEVPVTHRSRTMSIPKWLEEKIGRNMEAAVRGDEAEPLLSPMDNELARSVDAVSRHLIEVAEHDILGTPLPPSSSSPNEHAHSFPWRVLVVDAPIVNAFCAPGGLLVVYTGLVEFALRAERDKKISSAVDAVACVLAHEIAHGIARHGAEKMSWFPIQLPFLILALDSEVLVGPFRLMFELPHSRSLETEADEIGLKLLAMAGFDPKAGAQIFALFSGPLFGDWLSTHPGGERREKDLEMHMPEARELYESVVNGAKAKNVDKVKKLREAAEATWLRYFLAKAEKHQRGKEDEVYLVPSGTAGVGGDKGGGGKRGRGPVLISATALADMHQRDTRN